MAAPRSQGMKSPIVRKIFFACASTIVLPSVLAAAVAKQPNIVVLVADDWGYSDVGSFGGEFATPNIDQLAKAGVRFSNFHVAASCSPTRAMLLTGVDNHLNGMGNMDEAMPFVHKGKPGYEGVLTDKAVTLATLLKDGGYHTYIAGKWHLGKTPATAASNAPSSRPTAVRTTGKSGRTFSCTTRRAGSTTTCRPTCRPIITPHPSSSTRRWTTSSPAARMASPSSPMWPSRPTISRCRRRAH